MSVKVKRIQDRVDRLEPNPPAGDDQERWDRVVAKLSPDEREGLSQAIKAFEESGGCDSLETLPADQKAAWIRATKLYNEEEKP